MFVVREHSDGIGTLAMPLSGDYFSRVIPAAHFGGQNVRAPRPLCHSAGHPNARNWIDQLRAGSRGYNAKIAFDVLKKPLERREVFFP